MLTALAWATGHLLNVVSLRLGDVSLATPLLGAKVIFVALIGWLVFGQELSVAQWLSVGLATMGVIALGVTDFRSGRRVGLTTVTALGSALGFALTDNMIQAWGPRFGVWGFLPLVFAAVGVISAGLMPYFGMSSLRAPWKAWRWILVGAALSGLQAIIITGTIAVWKDAAGVNVVYATRGLWSIALVWTVGHRLKNTERHKTGPRVMAQRLAGAALILAGVVLALTAGLRR